MDTGQADVAVEGQLAELRLIQRIARVAGWEWDMATDEVSWSPEMFEFFGQDPESFELTYESFIACTHADDRGHVRATVEHAQEKAEPFKFSHRIVRPDGEERLALCRVQVLSGPDGRATRMVGASLDLSDLQGVGEELQASHDRLGAAEKLAGVGGFEYDAATDRVSWSKGMYRLFGLRPGDFDGTFAAYIERVHPDEREARRAELERALKERSTVESSARIRRGDGSYVAIRSRVEVVASAEGALGLIGVCWAEGKASP